MVPDDDAWRAPTAPGVSFRKDGGPGVSLRKAAAAPVPAEHLPAPAPVPPPTPPVALPTPTLQAPVQVPPGAGRPRRSRGVRAALAAVAVAVAVAGIVLGLAKPAHLVLEAVAVGVAPARSASSDGQPVALPAATPAEESASAEAPPTTAAPTTLAGVPLASMLLGSDALPAGMTLDGAEPVRGYTLDAYRAGYTGTMTPAACARLRGIMAFSGEADTGGTVIRRANDLRLGDVTGSQQVRRFGSAALATAFLDEQRAWFADCGVSTFTWPDRSTAFDGTVDADRGDVLLASADDVDSVTGRGAEFDGWVRRGDVVFGAYLIGTGADRDALRQAGAALITAAEDRLAALG